MKKIIYFITIIVFFVSSYAQKNPLTQAILKGNVKKVGRLVEKKPTLVNQENKLNWTPLIYAINEGSDTIVEILLKAKADVNVKINTGETPLHIAAKKGQSKIVVMLLDNGAKLEAQDLIRQTPLITAVRTNNIEVVKILLEKGADPNHATDSRRTALDWASTKEMKDLLKKYNAKTYKELYDY